VGNQLDWNQGRVNADAWTDDCLGVARTIGNDLKPLGDPAQSLAPINTDIAASTQKLFEETYLLATDALAKIVAPWGCVRTT